MADHFEIKSRRVILCIVYFLFIPWGIAGAEQNGYDRSVLFRPAQYGNLLINRSSAKYDMLPVTFSHWSHRLHYTCRVCHLELGFEMEVDTTVITEEKNRNGEFCGACHNGKIAFGHSKEKCAMCHNGDITYGKEKFTALASLPRSKFGNRIDWVKSMKQGQIRPKQSIMDQDYSPIFFKKPLVLKAEGSRISETVFSHEAHNQWLDCANCHPDIFNIKKKTTKHFAMKYILQGKFCGVCHLNVAFPQYDCRKCHPGVGQ